MDDRTELNPRGEKFYDLLKDAQQRLYEGCETYTRLSFVINLFQLKCLHNLSDLILDQFLEIFDHALPKPTACPKNVAEAHKMIQDLGLECKKNDSYSKMIPTRNAGEGIDDNHIQHISRIQEADGLESMSSTMRDVPGSNHRCNFQRTFWSNKSASKKNEEEVQRHEKKYCELEEMVRRANDEHQHNRDDLAALREKVNGFLNSVSTMNRSFGSSGN